jgi:aryl-alcohol dehydrogenase-like predicted oxidoreductase
MEYRRLGASGLTIPALSFGTGTFGGKGDFFAAWGNTDATGARRLLDVCLDAGVTLFDTADGYSKGESENVLGAAIKGRRDKVLISTKATFRFSDGPNDVGSSRYHLIAAIDAALKRLGTDYIDLFQLHDSGGGGAVDPRRPGAGRQDSLCRGFQLLRLAHHEVAGHGR